ncbi:MAG: hypothetical protein ACKUBY_02165 [Candidatus Moraniibacteriota bacterium]|jgi:hypothetical protein
MKDMPMTFFGPISSTHESNDTKDFVMICHKGVHLRLYSSGKYFLSIYLDVFGRCDGTCKKEYHKTDHLSSVFDEMHIIDCADIDRMVEDFPKLILNFLEKEIKGETARRYRRITGYTEDGKLVEIFKEYIVRPE